MLLLARHLLYYCASATAFFFLPFSLSFFHHAFFFLPFSLSFFHHVFQMGHLRPLFVYVSSFQAFLHNKNFQLRRDSNSDRRSWSWVRWPLDHHHGPSPCLVTHCLVFVLSISLPPSVWSWQVQGKVLANPIWGHYLDASQTLTRAASRNGVEGVTQRCEKEYTDRLS